MNIEELTDYQFYISLGYVTLIASVVTIIMTQLYKMILKKKKILSKDMDPDKKDSILAVSGRVIALIIYSLIYLGNEFILKHTIVITEATVIGLLSGGAATLTLAKGIYTAIRQHQKKKNVFEKLQVAEQQLQDIHAEAIIKQKIILSSRKEK